jgi:serine/threonine-protein phosphatase 2A regulatory subunit A
MVRRSAAKEMGGFTKQLDKDTLIKDLVPVFRKLSSDDQDSVRLLTVDSLIAIANAMDTTECKTYLGPTMKSMVQDKSWRVRYMVADNFVKVIQITASLMLHTLTCRSFSSPRLPEKISSEMSLSAHLFTF